MKFKCIKNERKFFFNCREEVSGLTVGKIYQGSLVAIGPAGYTVIIIYDDNNEWSQFWREELEFFKPAEE